MLCLLKHGAWMEPIERARSPAGWCNITWQKRSLWYLRPKTSKILWVFTWKKLCIPRKQFIPLLLALTRTAKPCPVSLHGPGTGLTVPRQLPWLAIWLLGRLHPLSNPSSWIAKGQAHQHAENRRRWRRRRQLPVQHANRSGYGTHQGNQQLGSGQGYVGDWRHAVATILGHGCWNASEQVAKQAVVSWGSSELGKNLALDWSWMEEK